MADALDLTGHVQAILDLLRAGGATDFQTTTNPVWVICRAPSGQSLQIVWRAEQQGYHVSRLVPGQAAEEDLGIFPEWEAAVACALQV